MKKKLLHILQVALCLPLFPLIGIPAEDEGGEQDGQDNQQKQENAGDGGEGGGDPEENESPEDEGGEKTVTMTQKELDALLNKRYRQGARNAQRKPGPKDKQQEDDGQKAAALLQKANDRLLAGTVKSLAGDLGITAKGAKAALKLMDFAGCFGDGGLDEEAVKDILEDFKDDYPEFNAADKEDRSGTGGAVGAKRKKTSPVSGIGARLAKEHSPSQTKSSFFK